MARIALVSKEKPGKTADFWGKMHISSQFWTEYRPFCQLAPMIVIKSVFHSPFI